MRKKTLVCFSLFVFFLTTLPLFFEIYRTSAFQTLPRDDYAPYLQALIGHGGSIPGAPFVYRILSVAAAAPFYYLIPPVRFTELKNLDPAYLDPAYLQATQALSLVSYLSIVLTAVVLYPVSRKQFHASPASALIVALLSFFLGAFVNRYTVDPIAVLMVACLVLIKDRPRLFAPLILLSVGVNEKIVIIMASLFTFRFLQTCYTRVSFSYWPQLISANAAAVCYFVIRQFIVKRPGFEQQLAPTRFLDTIQNTLVNYTMSFKGVYLGLLPVILLLVLVALAYLYRERSEFQIIDASCIFVLFALTLIGDVKFSIGRIVMYTFPLYLPAIGVVLDDILGIPRAVAERRHGPEHG